MLNYMVSYQTANEETVQSYFQTRFEAVTHYHMLKKIFGPFESSANVQFARLVPEYSNPENEY